MKYIERLLKDTDYIACLKELEVLEQQREFCRHNLAHLLDTARIAWIWNLEHQGTLEKEEVYLTALLHDLGRIREYQDGTPHDMAGYDMAKRFLEEIQVPAEMAERMLNAIVSHRENQSENELERLLYLADKKSRNCFFCKAAKNCKWPQNKRNTTIEY